MRASHALNEFRRFRGTVPRLLLVGLICVPLVAGGLVLWSTWDPYGRSGEVPVAIVDNDRPAVSGGKQVNAGSLLTTHLLAGQEFDWRLVDRSEAVQGLREGRYYLVVTIPKDFSASILSGTAPEPRPAEIEVTLDDSHGYLFGLMAEQVESRLRDRIDAAVHAAYARHSLRDIGTLRSSIAEASQTADSLTTTSRMAAQLSAELLAGLARLDRSAGSLGRSSEQLAAGTATLDDLARSAESLVQQEFPRLVTGLGESTGLATRLTETAAEETSGLRRDTGKAADQIQLLCRALPEQDSASLKRCHQALRAAEGAAQVASEFAATAAQARGDAREAAKRAEAFMGQVERLTLRVREGASEVQGLADDAYQAAGSVRALQEAIDDAHATAREIEADLGSLDDSAMQLASGLEQASGEIPQLEAAEQSKVVDTLRRPTRIESTNLHPAGVLGRGMAPFAIPVALWVFAVLVFQIVRTVNPRLLVSRAGAFGTALAGWIPAALLGSIGALVLLLALGFGLGLDPLSWPGTVAVTLLAGLAFVALTQLLRLAFGVAGTAIALVLLALQLAAAGGLYPIETTPAPFQWVHPALPMSYAIDGLRVTVSGGQAGQLWLAVGVLAAWTGTCLCLSGLVVRRHRGFTIRRLKPAALAHAK